MNVLGIESSCDESAVAIYHTERGLLADLVHSQASLHGPAGGVVPELASRDHLKKLAPLIREALRQAEMQLSELDAVAYTAGPGLVGALLVGTSLGASLAWSLGIPAIPIHHMEGHLLATGLSAAPPQVPYLCLLASGGHTQLVWVKAPGDYEILGHCLDDAAGEAFDKTAKLLGLGYPGGAPLAALAEQGTPGRFQFPRPMLNRPGLDFSFSGLKTAVATLVAKLEPLNSQTKADIAHAFECAVIDTLVTKCKRAVKLSKVQQLVLAGGVGANKRLRAELTAGLQPDAELLVPPPSLCTDNAAMIAYAGAQRLSQARPPAKVKVRARWPITELDAVLQ